ncbi:DmsC/YnfH family molybdoenzyme membrane anchor subunit [Stieleria varia]|uniref:Anaerobic dimethyl sulfoxide reductase chain B n=1 Tax=Stieleria varia TaxID=2528005 RepID=A0A5C5ZQ15_9BACT|nr:DmsC/YnfH family molybdoenzyme membrane anchor subunit [Stieleria varia]TWT89330.1 Anaerobic dimethyl sulfoxide reductase chain B [Stieleria varia]
MSATLSPVPLPVVDQETDLITLLLRQQSDLTAVEEFSQWHTELHCEVPSGPVQEKYYRSLLPASAPGPGQQFAFEVDLDSCSGCKACVVACHTLNGLEDEESWRKVGTLSLGVSVAGDGSLPGIQHVTTACHHCEDPGCLNGCPVKAYDKDPVTGIVRHLDDQCIGCKYCTMMCPYEVPQYSDRLGIVRKCDMCHQRLSVGEAPACVQSCPNEAIKIRIVDIGEETSQRLVPGAPESRITKPTTRFVSTRSNAIDCAVPQDHLVDHVAESHWPLAVMLTTTQAAVGLLAVELIVFAIQRISGNAGSDWLTPVLATTALATAGLGMGIAPLHLGQPFRAWRIFLGLRTSWLSREGVVLGKFTGLLALSVALLWLPKIEGYLPQSVVSIIQWIPAWTPRVAIVGAFLAGLAGLYCSAMIYIATKRQLWRMERTFPRFFGTCVITGTTCSLPVLIATGSTRVAIALGTLAIVAAGLKLVWEWRVQLSPRDVDSTTHFDSLDNRCRRLVWGQLSQLTKLRLATGALGIALLVLTIVASPWLTVSTALGCLAAACVIAGELCERLLYFSSVVHDRMPGTL